MDALINYLNAEYSIEPSATLSVLVTLFVFISGFALNELTKAISRYMLRKNTRLIFQQACGIIVNLLEKQSKVFSDVSSSFNFQNISLLSYIRVELTGVYLLEDIGYERVFNSLMVGIENRLRFSNTLRTRTIAKIWSINRAVRYIHEKAYNDIEHFLKEYNAKNEKRNSSLDKLRQTIYSIQVDLNGKEVSEAIAKYLNEIQIIYTEWLNLEDNSRPDIVHYNLVLKLYELDQKHHNQFFSPILNPLILNVISDYTNQKNHLENAALQYKYYARIMSQNARYVRLLSPVLMKRFTYRKRVIFNVRS